MSGGRAQTRRRLQILTAGLAAALIHQLGACPCGCIEGNLWVQSFLRQPTQSNRVVEASTDAPGRRQVQSHTCDDPESKTIYVAGQGVGPLGTHSGPASTVLAVCNSAKGVDPTDSTFRPEFSPGSLYYSAPARTLRAQRQIFLI